MSQQTAQSLEVALIAIIFALIVIKLSRSQKISFRYTVGWLLLCSISLFTGLLIPLLNPLAEFLQIDAFAVVAAASIAVLLLICIQLSISISGLQRRLQKMNEDIALTKEKLDSVRDKSK